MVMKHGHGMTNPFKGKWRLLVKASIHTSGKIIWVLAAHAVIGGNHHKTLQV